MSYTVLQMQSQQDPASNADSSIVLARCKDKWRQTLIERNEIMKAFDAEENRARVVDVYAERLGKSKSTLYRMYYGWRDRGLQALVPASAIRKAHAHVAEGGASLPAETREWIRTLIEDQSDDNVTLALRRAKRCIEAGQNVPGLGTWRALWASKYPNIPPPRTEGRQYPRNDIESLLPRGFSKRTFNRIKAEKLERVAAQRGTFAASNMGPMVYTTRVGVPVGKVLVFDDVWHNQKVNYVGQSKALRVIELCCLDLASAHKVAWGARPRTYDPEKKKHEGIKDFEFRMLLAHTLCEEVGYRKDGTILWVERGTAAIDETLAAALEAASGGAITVKRAPLKDARQVCSIYRGVKSGNPRFKAHLESHHNLAHGELSAVAGQVGRSADVQPEEVEGRDKANDLILKIAAVLPPAARALLETPYLHWDEYMDCVIAAYDEIAWRTWHNLEGWEACRNFCREFHVPGVMDWTPMDALNDIGSDIAANVSAMLEAHPEFCRIRKLAPIEVWQKSQHEMTRLPKHLMPLIMGPKAGAVRTCPESADIKFESRMLGPDPHIYSREYVDEDGVSRRMQAGREYMYHINPFSPARELFVSTPDNVYLGMAPRINVPSRMDESGVRAQINRKRAEWARIAKRVSGRHLTKLANQAMAMERNAALVGAAADNGMLAAAGVAMAQAEEEKPQKPKEYDEDSAAALLELSGMD